VNLSDTDVSADDVAIATRIYVIPIANKYEILEDIS